MSTPTLNKRVRFAQGNYWPASSNFSGCTMHDSLLSKVLASLKGDRDD